MVLSEINAALSLWGKFKEWYRSRKNPNNLPSESIAARFIRLFETHGVHRNQIPRFFGHGLTLKDVEEDASLLAKLDEEMMEEACALFAVRREWLDGAEKQAHPEHDFYKHPEGFVKFLDDLLAANPDGDFHGVLIAPEESDGRAESLLILQETIGAVGEKPIYRFHLCNNWSLNYWKSRGYLTACVAIAWKRNVFISGVYMPKKEIAPLAYGETLMGWQGEGIWFIGHRKWYPEDMALRPDAYLEGVDSERNNFGIATGLRHWLDLEEQGLMDTGLGADFSVKAKRMFEQELAKYPNS